MPELHTLVSTDGRTPLERLRRSELRKMLDSRQLPYPPTAGKDALVAMCKSLEIDPLAQGKWVALPEKDETGRDIGVRQYPVRDQNASARVDSAQKMNALERAAEQAATPVEEEEANDSIIALLREENLRLKEENFAMKDTITARLAKLEATQLPLSSMTAWQLAKVAREHGLTVKKNEPKSSLMPRIEAHINGENPAPGSERGSEEG